MAGNEMGIVAHRPQALGDQIEQLLMIAAGKIRPAIDPGTASPTIASFDSGWWKTTWPGVWPGQWRTLKVSLPTVTVSPSTRYRSDWNGLPLIP